MNNRETNQRASEDDEEITNQTSKEVAIINSFNADDIQTNTIYENKLTHFKTTDGKDSILSGETKTVTLKGNYYEENGDKKPGDLYTLLCTDPKTLLPIENYTVDRVLTPSYPPHTIPKEIDQKYALALKFYARIKCFPTSRLASSFAEQLNQLSKKRDAKAIDEWFKRQKLYKDLNFEIVSVAMSYMDTYPTMLFQKDSEKASNLSENQQITFYFYSPSESSGFPGEKKPPTYMGRMVLKNNGSDLDMLDPNKRFTATYYEDGSESNPVSLTYSKSNFSSEEGVEICVQASFTVRGNLTNDAKDKKIIPVLVGQINNIKVMGVTTKQNLKNPEDPKSFYAFFHPESFQAWVNLLMVLLMFGMVLIGVVKFIWWIYKKVTGSNPPGPRDRMRSDEETRNLLREQSEAEYAKINRSYRRMGGRDTVDGPDLPPRMAEARGQVAAAREAEAAIYRTESIRNAMELNEIVMQDTGGPDSEIERIGADVRAHSEELKEALDEWARDPSPEATQRLRQKLEGLKTRADALSSRIKDWQNKRMDEASQEIRREVSRNQQTQNEVREDEEEMREDAEKSEDGTDGADEDIDDIKVDF